MYFRIIVPLRITSDYILPLIPHTYTNVRLSALLRNVGTKLIKSCKKQITLPSFKRKLLAYGAERFDDDDE